jgi:hypothetical protein
MAIRLHVKNQQPQTVTKFDILKPIEQVGAELIEKAKAEAKAMVAKAPLVVEKATEKAVEEVSKAVDEAPAAKTLVEKVVEVVTSKKASKSDDEEKPAKKNKK